MRYCYRQNGTENYLNLKTPLVDTAGYTEITEEEFNSAQEVKRHIPTEEEIARNEKRAEIASLKRELARTDYLAIKHSEGWISDNDYAEVKAQRQEWRDRINELELSINQ